MNTGTGTGLGKRLTQGQTLSLERSRAHLTHHTHLWANLLLFNSKTSQYVHQPMLTKKIFTYILNYSNFHKKMCTQTFCMRLRVRAACRHLEKHPRLRRTGDHTSALAHCRLWLPPQHLSFVCTGFPGRPARTPGSLSTQAREPDKPRQLEAKDTTITQLIQQIRHSRYFFHEGPSTKYLRLWGQSLCHLVWHGSMKTARDNKYRN